MIRLRSALGGTLLLASVGVVGPAAGGDRLSEQTFLEELPVVLSASRLAQSPHDAPAAVTVIDREAIRASGFTEIHDIFRLVPGYLVADWPEGSPIVVNQGMGDPFSRRLLILVDGRAVFDPFLGGVDWQDLPLRVEDIDRIEVVRSPNPASYGANAFQGVINIFTRRPEGGSETEAVVRLGRHHLTDVYAGLTRGDGAVSWRLSASSRGATNYRDEGVPLQMYREGIHRNVMNGQLRWTPRSDQEVTFHLGVSDGHNLIGQTDSSSNPRRTTETGTLFVQAGWKHFYATDSEVSLRYYHYGRNLEDRYHVMARDPLLAPVPALTVDEGYRVRRNDIEFQQIHAWTERLKLIWGTGIRHDEAVAGGMLSGLGSVGGRQWQMFGTVDWQFARDWRVQAGGMVEKHYNTERLFSPRLAFSYRIAPEHSLRLSVGRGYRAPTIFEAKAREMVAYSGGVAEVQHYAYRDLAPESVRYAEFGYYGHMPALGLGIDARLYANHYRNFIDEQSCILDGESQGFSLGVQCSFTPPAGYERPLGFAGKSWVNASLPFGTVPRYGHYKAFYFFNAGSLRVLGNDISVDWRNSVLGRFRASYAVTRIAASGIGSDTSLSSVVVTRDVDAEVSAPRHAYSLLWARGLPYGFNVSAGFYKVGQMKWPNGGDWQPAYRRVDLRLGKALGLFGRQDELSLTVQNYNSEHTEFSDYLVEKRAFLTYRAHW